jgi:hypothetical protein
MVLAALTAGVHAAEIDLRHINDQFAASPVEDDLYTATLGIAGTVNDWTLGLDEYVFTDRANGLRFDETYLTVARDLLRPDSKWRLRARIGAVHVGKGLYGERLQNFVHSILGEDEVDLAYVPGSQSYVFVRLNVSRRLHANERLIFLPLVEIESAGFKEHARAALGVRFDLSERFNLHAEAGARFTDTSYAPLVLWIKDSEPTFGVGAGYKNFLDLTWTSNYFGTGDNHWHISMHLRFGAGTKKQD